MTSKKFYWYIALMLLVFAIVTARYTGKLTAKYQNAHEDALKDNIILIENIEKLKQENEALRRIVLFEQTFLPYFSKGTKDKLLSTEGCLKLGG